MLNADTAQAPASDARRRAIAGARAEFEAVQAQKTAKAANKPQGLLGWLRLIVDGNDDNGRSIMSLNQKFAYSGMGAIAVGVIGVSLTLQNQTLVDAEHTTPEVVVGKRTPANVDGETRRENETRNVAMLEEAVVTANKPYRGDAEAPPPETSMQMSGDKRARLAAVAEPKADIKRDSYTRRAQPAIPAELDDAAAVGGTAKERVVVAKKLASSVPSSVAAPMREALQMGIVADTDVATTSHYKDVGRDKFEAFEENRVTLVSEEPVSTFSADVDTASYSFVRRMLNNGVLPQGDAVRAEELINYFDYSYSVPDAREQPFAPTVSVTDAPWAEGRKLMHIGIKGYDVAPQATPRSNLVFLLDVSGSMNSPDKLPLVKQSMELLLSTLKPDDTVAIAVYAGAAGVVLEPTPVADKQKIMDAMHRLSAGGSTAGAQGIRLAYELAAANLDKEAVNRVILATDGDFNVGITDQRELRSFIERKRDEGIFLSVLGFGQGNYRDALMQTLAQNGNGVAAYIDTLGEAQKVLVEEATSTLFPIAKDVKFQVEFNPATVAEYRLIGYETRHLNREDFNNDAVDAGDVGAGHTVTAMYEFTPTGSDARYIEESRYRQAAPAPDATAAEYAFLKIRYKLPEEDTSRLITRPVTVQDETTLGGDSGFATAVAGFAQVLKGGKYTGEYSYDDVVELALATRGDDPYGYRSEFVQLVRKAKTAAAMQRR
ncbi:MAG: VWA domain-containing protein [Halioglobus sp.]|nr:VWA domain-containing protein [Halioglobus sp.]